MSTFDKVELSKMNYGIVLNDFPLLDVQEIDLGDWILRRATLEEIEHFREQLVRYSIARHISQVPFQEVDIEPSGDGFLYTRIKDRESWRYMIVVPKDKNSISGDKLSEAFRISDLDLWIELWNIKSTNNEQGFEVGGSPLHYGRFLTEDRHIALCNKIEFENYLKNIIFYRKQFNDAKYPAISKALKMFRENDVNREKSLKHLSYFAVIESILSHAPSPNDTVDSISRQLKRNLVLLNNRMDENYNLMFDKFNGIGSDKLISKLYSYRSSIAHGNNSDSEIDWFYQHRANFGDDVKFFHKELFMSWYLRKIVQRILVQAIKEPQLITDLKG